MARKASKTKLYVNEMPFHFWKGTLPDRETKSDVVYGFSEKAVQKSLDSFLDKGVIPRKLLADYVVERKQGASPARPDPFDFIDWTQRGALSSDVGGQVEYELSPEVIIRTTFSYDPDGKWYASRDVITGKFAYKKGKFSGLVTGLMDGQYSSDPVDHDAHFLFYEAPSPIPVKSLRVMDGGYGPSGSIFALNSQVLDLRSPDLLASYPTTQIAEHPLGRFFFDGWYNDPFSGNLI